MTDDLGTAAGTPDCPKHLVLLESVGDGPEGHDARWECVVPDYTGGQVA